MDILNLSPSNIWNYRQNHPELVIKDCKEHGFTEEQLEIVRKSMLCRGINKWLKVRRDLIAYKKLVKHEIRALVNEITLIKQELKESYVPVSAVLKDKTLLKKWSHTNQLITKLNIKRALLKDKERIRRDLKELCMTERWQIWEGKKLKDMNTITASD